MWPAGFTRATPTSCAVPLTLRKRVCQRRCPSGYRDLHGFGRRPIPGLKASEIENLVAYQIGALQAIATAAGHKVTHVKAHGALSNVACDDDMTAKAIANGIKAVDPQPDLRGAGEFASWYRPAKPPTYQWSMKYSPTAPMRMTARWCRAASPARCCTMPAKLRNRVVRMVQDGAVVSVTGKVIKMRNRHRLHSWRHPRRGRYRARYPHRTESGRH